MKQKILESKNTIIRQIFVFFPAMENSNINEKINHSRVYGLWIPKIQETLHIHFPTPNPCLARNSLGTIPDPGEHIGTVGICHLS